MRMRPQILVATVAIVCALVAVIAGGTMHVMQAAENRVPPPFSPTVQACVDAHHPICNPGAYAKLLAQDPLARPPSSHPVYISQDRAMTEARRIAGAPATVVTHELLMSRRAFEDLEKEHTIHDQDRKVWVVTVHADITDMRTGNLAHYYTVAIDGETGVISDILFERALAG